MQVPNLHLISTGFRVTMELGLQARTRTVSSVSGSGTQWLQSYSPGQHSRKTQPSLCKNC